MDAKGTVTVNGGPHWDVQDPKTGKHENIYPKSEIPFMTHEAVMLTVENLPYYSQYDEDMFFHWLNGIDGVEECKGSGNILYVQTVLSG